MDLLALDDPVFLVDLTPPTMEACRAYFLGAAPLAGTEDHRPPSPPGRPIRALALVFAWDSDPVMLAIRPTVDTELLDTTARLIRMALLTEHSVAHLVTEAGDAHLKRLYFSRRLPRFIYEGVPETVRHRLPAALVEALGRRRRRAG